LIQKVGVEIETVNAYGKTRSDEFLKMNPCHVCPTLELDDGTALWESCAVLRYFATTSGESGEAFYPKDPILRAKIDMAMDWRQTEWYKLIPSIGYIAFGMAQPVEKAQADFKTMKEELFPVVTGTFLNGTKFIFSDTPTIADLCLAPTIRFLSIRPKFWEQVPQEIKDYEKRFHDFFSENKENWEMFAGMCAGCEAEGVDAEP
jgi:glutathione S-transferase